MATDFAREVERVMTSQIGVQEQPRGSNAGPRVSAYLKAVDQPPGQPWCSALVCWSVLKAALSTGLTPTLQFSPSALHLWSLNPDLQFHDLSPDDIPCIGIYDHGQGKGHVVLVCGYDPDAQQLQTCEGNTDPEGGREGYMVAARTRDITDPGLLGFLRIE